MPRGRLQPPPTCEWDPTGAGADTAAFTLRQGPTALRIPRPILRGPEVRRASAFLAWMGLWGGAGWVDLWMRMSGEWGVWGGEGLT